MILGYNNTNGNLINSVLFHFSFNFGGILIPGIYRVMANDSSGNYYAYIDWTAWENDANLEIPINRSHSSAFNYTIEFYDVFSLKGIPDTIIGLGITTSVILPIALVVLYKRKKGLKII